MNRTTKITFIVSFAIIMLLALVLWRPNAKILGIKLVSGQGQSEIHVAMNRAIDPIIEIESKSSSIRFDFLEMSAVEELLKEAISDDFIRLGYLFNGAGPMTVAGLRVFPRRGGLKSVKKTDAGLIITISENAEALQKSKLTSESLLKPDEEKFAPVSLSLKEARTLPVLHELARKADIELATSGKLPELLTVRIDCANAFEALRIISAEMGCKMELRQKVWWLIGEEA